MKLGCLSLIIGLVGFLVEIVMLGTVGIELAEISIGLKTIGVTASSAEISTGVMAIEGVVID
jgi:hypothetical protein